MAEAETKTPDKRELVRKIIFEADTPSGKAFDVILIIAIIASVGVVCCSLFQALRNGMTR